MISHIVTRNHLVITGKYINDDVRYCLGENNRPMCIICGISSSQAVFMHGGREEWAGQGNAS